MLSPCNSYLEAGIKPLKYRPIHWNTRENYRKICNKTIDKDFYFISAENKNGKLRMYRNYVESTLKRMERLFEHG